MGAITSLFLISRFPILVGVQILVTDISLRFWFYLRSGRCPCVWVIWCFIMAANSWRIGTHWTNYGTVRFGCPGAFHRRRPSGRGERGRPRNRYPEGDAVAPGPRA